MKNLFIPLLFTLCFWSFNSSSQSSEFKPGQIWPDNNGVHINAHGGGILIFDNTYYWFGEHKTEGEGGNRTNVGVHVYSSKNLTDWKDEGIALKVIENDENHDITKGCVLERPKVIYNKNTKKFVMWFHLELKGRGYDAARTGLAVADKVIGPYVFVKSLRPNAGQWPMNFTEEQKNAQYDYAMERYTPEGNKAVINGMYVKRDFEGGQMSRDMTLFVDDDGKAYHIAASEENGTLHIRELTDDYLDFTGKYVRAFPDESNEAPAIFKTDGKYYMVTSGCTGWAPNPGRSAVADKMFGPWTNLGNPFKGTEEQMKTSFDYMGDRWTPKNAIDGRYIWLPIKMGDGKFKIEWMDSWDMSFFDR